MFWAKPGQLPVVASNTLEGKCEALRQQARISVASFVMYAPEMSLLVDNTVFCREPQQRAKDVSTTCSHLDSESGKYCNAVGLNGIADRTDDHELFLSGRKRKNVKNKT